LDTNILKLYWKVVNAGYANFGIDSYVNSLTGVPCGARLGGLFMNIYLDELDIFLRNLCACYKVLIPLSAKNSKQSQEFNVSTTNIKFFN